MSHTSDHDAQELTCMEVWGGNQIAESGVIMTGLDAWVFCPPYQNAARGGDVYYMSSCATGRINRLLVADVSGHGDQVAATASHLRGLMRRFINHINQGKFIARMNEQFALLADMGGFATAAVATFYAPTNELLFSSAGHPPPLFYQSKRRVWMTLDAKTPGVFAARQSRLATEETHDPDAPADLPLGLLDDSRYSEYCLPLQTGDLVLFYTDSLIECSGADGQLLSTRGLLEIVRSLPVDRPEAFIAQLLESLRTLHPNNLTEDDVTALLIRPNGLAPRMPFKNMFLGPWRLFGGLLASILRLGRDAPWPEWSRRNLLGQVYRPIREDMQNGRSETHD